MATNWWEIGKPVQDFEPAAQEEKKEQNWWEIGQPVDEPVQQAAQPAAPQPAPTGFGPLGLLTESIRSMKASAEGQQTVNPILGATARGAELAGSALETAARLGQVAPQTFTATGPAISAIKSISPQLQQWADSFRNWGKEINYAPTTQLGELSDNPAKVVPFVLERVITSSPDMLAAYAALPAYIPTRANEILNERLKNDGRSLNEATIGDVAASAAAATVEGTLERFATRQLGVTEGILRPTVLQAGTEAVEEVGAYAGETVGTKAGFDPTQAGLIAAEAAIVGGGLGGTVATGTELVRRNIESRVRDLEGVGTDIEQRELQKLRDQAIKDAQTITAPELTNVAPVQYGDAYAQRVYDSIGQYIPANAEFKVEEKVVDGTPRFVVTDKAGIQYGQTLQDKAQADAFALSLNNTTKSRAEVLKQLEPLETSLKDTLKGFGLNDVGLTLSNRVFTRRGEALTSEGLFDPVVRRVFLAVDAVDPQGTLDTNQRREALRGVLRHEVVHALRYLDLWKRSEWKNLEQTVGKVIKPGTNKTYLEIAKEAYGDQSPVIQVEEGVADLIRDVAGNISRVAGRPRSLSERAINFFDKAKNALTGAGFQTYEDIVQRFEQGDIGARQRGRIRTFRATEEQQAAQGVVPERIQKLIASPAGRNQFRQEVTQETESQIPAVTAPARNSVRLNALRESRSTIERVPPTINVDNEQFPTRDSEGRLIYSGYEGQEVFGIPTRPTQEGLQNFWKSFKGSKAVDKQGRPQLYLHGTAGDITAFRPKQAGSVFITRNPQFAEEFAFLSDNYMVSNFPDFMADTDVVSAVNETLSNPAAFTPKLFDKISTARDQAVADIQQNKAIRPSALKVFKDIAAEGRSSRYLDSIQRRLPSSANLVPVYVNAQKPWDYDSKDDVKAVVKRARDNGADITASMVEEIGQGNWQTIEGSEGNAPILDAIRELGYDSMYVEEQGEKNLAVFDPNQIKSAVGNNGDFSPITPSIRESRVPREKTLEEIDAEIAALDAAEAVEREKISEIESFARRSAENAIFNQGNYSDLQDSIDSSRENIRETLKENTFGPNSTRYEEQAFAAYDSEIEKLRKKSNIAPTIRESRKPVYNIINSRTGEVVGQANTIGGARRSVDRRDNQYGASVHTIQTVDPERDIAARNVARERLGLPPIERESRVPTTKAPDWASQKVWDLHEKMRRAREESSGLVETEFPTRVLRRNSTMSARRLLDGIGEYLGLADRSTLEGQKQVIDFWGRLSDESYRREPYTLPSIRESRGVNIEVAPDPRDQVAVDTFNAFPENVRAEITTEVAEPVIRDTMRNLGIADYEVEYTLGGFQGGTQPSIIIRFGNAVPYNKMLEASKVLGTLWKQQAVIVYDENDKQGGVQTQFVKVIPSRKLSYDETKDLFKQIYNRYPDAAGFTGREGSLVFGNFSGSISPEDFHRGLDTALEDIDNDYSVTTTSDNFRSDWIEPVNLQGTQYESDTQRPVEGGEVLRRQREFDSLQERSDEFFRAAVQKRTGAEAAPAEAITPAVRESRAAVPRSSVSIFEMPDEQAKRELGLDPGKNITRLVGERLNQRTLDDFGKIQDTDTSDQAARQIADAMVSEVLYQLQTTAQTGTGIGWYSNNYPRALSRLANRFPELAADPNARSLFTAIVAITSNGEDVNQNISNAIAIYSEARKGRRLSDLSVGTRRSDALQNNLEGLDALVEEYGLDGFSRVLLEEMSVKDINAELRRRGEETDSAYTADTVMPRAALYFGPKLGAFYANLMGSEGYLTMDLWWSRMFNRMRGTLIPKPTQSSINTIRQMLVDIGMLPPSWVQGIIPPTDEEVIEAAVPFWESAKNKKYKNTTALEKAANTLIKSARLELEEAPFRASDRSFMIRTTRLAQDQLRNRGVNLSLADIQAALWYYEKRLYGKLTGRATDDIGYEEAILKAAEGARPERSDPQFYRGLGGGVVTQRANQETRRVVPSEIQAVTPSAREARRGIPAGPTDPGPATDADDTSAAQALNGGQPVDSIGVPTGPQLTDTMPDGTVDISRARLAPLTNRLVVQMIQSAPDKLRSGFGLDDLAKRIENYYDTYASRLGVVNGVIRDAYKRIGLRDRRAALETFEQFIRARENGRNQDAQDIFNNATDSERQLILAWDQISGITGQINTSIRTPSGKPMRVWDSKAGEWRPIKSVRNFFPRTLRKEVMEVMKNPDLDPALWQELLDSLIASGRAENTAEAEDYLVKEWFSDEIKQDYFAGVEKARSEPLPEVFYDYSWDAATRYLRKWARRTSQIENFGQTLGTFQKEWFETNIPKIRDQDTQNYLNAIRERIYEIENFSFLNNLSGWLNSLATAAQLGNPVSASLNLFGGTITNVQEFGIKEITKAYIQLVKDWKNVQKEGTTLGILNKDFMNILNDHVEMDADKYFSKEQKVSQALAKFTNVMLTFGGFNGAENIVRSVSMLAARSRLNSFLNDMNAGQETKQVQAFREWVKRENLDIDALIAEDGAGPETERFMRRAVNVPQGSYQIDMTPVFIDTTAGRFFLKYQKFGTQINRFFYNHFLKPFYDKPNLKNFMRIVGFLGTAIIGGQAIAMIREALGYGDPGPDEEEIAKAFENQDIARAWSLIFSRAWQNIMTAGSLGFFANYAQLAKDWQDQQRVKSPLSPPGLASVDAVLDVFNRLRDQGRLTARDLDEIAETTMSFYRANKRIGLAAMDSIGADYKEVKRFAAQKEIREVREYGRRYSEAMEIEFKQRTAPGKVVRTPMTPTNKAITDALQQGDAGRARMLVREAMKGVPVKEREKILASIRASVRNRQPIQVGGNAPSQQELQAFLRWSRQNLPKEKYQMIIRADRRYKMAAMRAGIGFGQD